MFWVQIVYPCNYMVLVKEEYDENNRTYNREFLNYNVTINKQGKTILLGKPVNPNPFEHLKNINNTWDLIGVLRRNTSDIAFFRFGANIQYCTVDEVNTYLISNFI